MKQNKPALFLASFSPRVDILPAKRQRRGRVDRLLHKAVIETIEPRILLSAYGLSPLASFDGTGGGGPQAAVTFDANGNLFGTTPSGGEASLGTVYEIPKGSTTVTTIASFTGPGTAASGANPQGAVTFDKNGNLFGTTAAGGANGVGTVYEIIKGTTTITTIASFNKTNGANPNAAVTFDKNGNLFGTTVAGGDAIGDGVVFEIAAGTKTITTFAAFNAANGSNPFGAVTFDSTNNLFGTTFGGGDASGDGTVFEIAAGTKTITTVAKFAGANGAGPEGAVIFDATGNLFGTTSAGGDVNGDGTIFKIAKGTKTIATVAMFSGANGSNPFAGLTFDKNGNLWGTASGAGPGGSGTVFEIVKNTTAIKTVASFNGANGGSPQAGVTFDASGNLFGTTGAGGASGNGTVFEVPVGSTSINAVASFNGNRGVSPSAAIIFDKGGDIFGTTSAGGSNGSGTVFEIIKGSTSISTVANFLGFNGSSPNGVTFDASGNLFGTTAGGGDNGLGTVFEIPSGSRNITTIASFNGTNGSTPMAGVAFDKNGNLFGTTKLGGASGAGTVFEIVKGTSTITTVASFNGANGRNPLAAVTFDANGNLFGTTSTGNAANGPGTVFEIVKGTKTITTVATFNGQNGSLPNAVVFDKNGNLFGTSQNGGSTGAGTIFEILAGTKAITLVSSFSTATTGSKPTAVVIDSNGNLFGATAAGGSNLAGTVFEVPNGSKTIQTLFTFSGPNGSSPVGVTLDANGNFFGATAKGGAHNDGTVFKLTPPINVTAPASQTATSGAAKSFALGSFTQTGATGPFTVTIHWGDGSADTTFVQASAGTITPQLHTFAVAGVDVVRVTVMDSKGAISNAAQFGVTITSAAARLVIVKQPTTGTHGVTLSPSFVVYVEDALGNIVTTDFSFVTLAVSFGPAGGALVGVTTVSAANGVATFGPLSLSTPGTYYLTATDGAPTVGLSAGIVVK